jgi:ribosomal protein L37E
MARYGKCKRCGRMAYTSITRDTEGNKIGHLCSDCWFGEVKKRAGLNTAISRLLP